MSKKEKKKDKNKLGFPVFPGMTLPKPPALDAFGKDWAKGWEDSGKGMKQFKDDFTSLWEKGIDAQKSAIDGSKDQYDQFHAFMSERLDDFADLFPDEMPLMPSWAQTPKSFRESMKDWEEMVNKHFVEQMNSWTDFFIESQEKLCEQISSSSESDEEADEATEAEAKDEAKTKEGTK